MRVTLNHESEFSAHAAEYFCLTNEKRQYLSDTYYEQGTKKRQTADYFGGFPLQKKVDITMAMITAVLLDSVVLSVVHIVLL